MKVALLKDALFFAWIEHRAGDLVEVTGIVAEYYGLTQVVPSGADDVKVLGRVQRPYRVEVSAALEEERRSVERTLKTRT